MRLKEPGLSGFNEIRRKKTKEVKVGGLIIGGKNPVVIQEMTSTRTSDIDATVQIFMKHLKQLQPFLLIDVLL